MTVMLYPTKTEPMGYRVQDKVYKINEYFPFSKFGDSAKKKAEKRQEELNHKRKYRTMSQNLDINQIFDQDGKVIGLKRMYKKKSGKYVDVLFFQIGVNGKQKSSDISLNNKTFKEAYRIAQDKILKLRNLERDLEITLMFRRAEKYYNKIPALPKTMQ